jgi:hypothetical protein
MHGGEEYIYACGKQSRMKRSNCPDSASSLSLSLGLTFQRFSSSVLHPFELWCVGWLGSYYLTGV